VSALLEAERVHLRHVGTDHDAVRDVSLEVRAGEVMALVGPNGSGKSTLLAAFGREIAPRSGSVRFAGVEMRRIPRRKLARRLARLPQEPSVPEGLTVESLIRQGRHPHRRLFAKRSARDGAAEREAISAMELGDLRGRRLETLSGGERRRAWLGMVLAQEPELLLLDEPTTALDLRHQWQVIELLARINRERGIALVIALHDLAQAAELAHRVAVMHRGRLYAVEAPERCLTEETLRDVFAVDASIEKRGAAIAIHVRGPAVPVRSF
jgi:iron complex transport system ATP-binding protein